MKDYIIMPGQVADMIELEDVILISLDYVLQII
ncbi:hypothetical protein Psch_02210 [Pelotomaculum schinkii]|uniref:Uncharacterized protein n=1 Tax=Pelotomaculum schinkii TaxID=78350 RepID=A0A4Y7RI31_9FIRM|nr:hypothetical protein Psch_02210 [Pelotomaculum schinkii]